MRGIGRAKLFLIIHPPEGMLGALQRGIEVHHFAYIYYTLAWVLFLLWIPCWGYDGWCKVHQGEQCSLARANVGVMDVDLREPFLFFHSSLSSFSPICMGVYSLSFWPLARGFLLRFCLPLLSRRLGLLLGLPPLRLLGVGTWPSEREDRYQSAIEASIVVSHVSTIVARVLVSICYNGFCHSGSWFNRHSGSINISSP